MGVEKAVLFSSLPINHRFLANDRAYIKDYNNKALDLSAYKCDVVSFNDDDIVSAIGHEKFMEPLVRDVVNLFISGHESLALAFLRRTNLNTFITVAARLSKCDKTYKFMACGPMPDGTYPDMNAVEYFEDCISGYDQHYWD